MGKEHGRSHFLLSLWTYCIKSICLGRLFVCLFFTLRSSKFQTMILHSPRSWYHQRALRNALMSRGVWRWFGLASLLVSSMVLKKAIMSRGAQMWFGDVWTYSARVTEYWTFFIESSIKSKQNCLGKLGQLLAKGRKCSMSGISWR